MKPNRKPRPLAKQYEQLFVPILLVPTNMSSDLRQPDPRPMISGVVSGGAAEAPVETWSDNNAKLARDIK